MFTSIINWLKGLFSSPNAKELATVAASLIVANNKDKAVGLLAGLKTALLLAKTGGISRNTFQSAMSKLITNQKDKVLAAAIVACVNVPNIKVGEANQDVIDILETLISVIEAA